MARLEDVLPALREGKKLKRKQLGYNCFAVIEKGRLLRVNRDGAKEVYFMGALDILADNWHVVPEPVRVADYLVPIIAIEGWIVKKNSRYERQTHPIGQQPEGSVLVPGSERNATQ